MDFSNALEMLKDGYKMRRFTWREGTFITYNSADSRSYINAQGETVTVLAWIVFHDGDRKWQWLCSQNDILTDDWMCVG